MAIISFSQNPTLNEIAQSLAARVDKEHDMGFIAEIKHMLTYKRLKLVHDYLAAHPQNWIYFIQSFTVETELIDADTEQPITDKQGKSWIARSVCELPEPLRDNRIKRDWQLFDFVGSASGYTPYQYYQPEYLDLLAAEVYTSKRKKWFWKNGFIHVLNVVDAEPVQVRGVFEDALWFDRMDACDKGVNVFDDEPFPVPRDLLDTIVLDVLTKELQAPVPSELQEQVSDVKVDTVKKTQHVST